MLTHDQVDRLCWWLCLFMLIGWFLWAGWFLGPGWRGMGGKGVKNFGRRRP